MTKKKDNRIEAAQQVITWKESIEKKNNKIIIKVGLGGVMSQGRFGSGAEQVQCFLAIGTRCLITGQQ